MTANCLCVDVVVAVYAFGAAVVDADVPAASIALTLAVGFPSLPRIIGRSNWVKPELRVEK